MAAVETVVPVEVRAAELRARILEDMDRVERIGDELGVIDEEIRAVRAAAVVENPMAGDLDARARTAIKKLASRHAELIEERAAIENLLPHREKILEELEGHVRALGVEELRSRRLVLDEAVRESLAEVASRFRDMVVVWAADHVVALEAVAAFNAEVRGKGLERVEGLIGSPIEAVPTDLLRLVELLSHATGIRASNAGALFIEACGVGDDLGVLVADAEGRLRGLQLATTSWASQHGPGEGW
jgi:hypothetical protein